MNMMRHLQKRKPVIDEQKKPDMSIWVKDVPVYIETESIAERTNEFREDYRKLVMCITKTRNIFQVNACRKMYTFFTTKHNISTNVESTNSKTYDHKRQFAETVCGYIENLLQQQEAKFCEIF
jgi:hypothetical protein